jgi:hypothetical protein
MFRPRGMLRGQDNLLRSRRNDENHWQHFAEFAASWENIPDTRER